jgi:hypothetical protein
MMWYGCGHKEAIHLTKRGNYSAAARLALPTGHFFSSLHVIMACTLGAVALAILI